MEAKTTKIELTQRESIPNANEKRKSGKARENKMYANKLHYRWFAQKFIAYKQIAEATNLLFGCLCLRGKIAKRLQRKSKGNQILK